MPRRSGASGASGSVQSARIGGGISPCPPPAGASTIEATPGPSATAGASITIDAVGDISLARQIVDRMNENGPDYPYALIAPLIDADIGFANLEGALTEGGTPWPKGYNFRT